MEWDFRECLQKATFRRGAFKNDERAFDRWRCDTLQARIERGLDISIAVWFNRLPRFIASAWRYRA